MRFKRVVVTVILATSLGGCSGGSSPEPDIPVPADEPSGLPTQVIQDAQNVADQLEQRYVDMESMVP
jgi:hypothetical protein